MKRIGADINAIERWEGLAFGYADHIQGAYHRHRLEVVSALLPDLLNKTVIDFGCGDGVLSEIAVACGAKHVIGIDPVQSLLDVAAKRAPSAVYVLGGIEALSAIEHCDVLIAANVLAYLSDGEEALFYKEAARLCRFLVVTHSNSLFDLFTFNAYTVDFYKRQFGVDPSSLLVNPTKPDRATFNIRENPLAYGEKLCAHRFSIEHMEFMNYHRSPPLLTHEDPDDMERHRADTLSAKQTDRWKLMFQCSMFGVRAIRT